MSDADQTIGTNRATCQSSLPMTKLDYKSLVGSRTETTNNEFNIYFYLSFSQTIARGTTQSSLPMTKLDYKSLTGSRTEIALTEFATMFYVGLTQQIARGTTQSSLPMTKLDYKSLVGSRTETTNNEFNISFLNSPVTARGTVTATDFGFKKSIQMVEG